MALAFWPDSGTMGAVSQLLCLLLAALFALAGGPLSLCACGPGSHVAVDAAPAASGCCGPSEPGPAAPIEPACCCCAEPADGPEGPSLAAACECPELDLSLPAAEVASSVERTATSQHTALLAPLASPSPPAPLAGPELLALRAAPPPDPGALPRRHLLLHVLRH